MRATHHNGNLDLSEAISLERSALCPCIGAGRCWCYCPRSEDERKGAGQQPSRSPRSASPFTAPLSAPTQSADLLLASGLYESSAIGVRGARELSLDVDGRYRRWWRAEPHRWPFSGKSLDSKSDSGRAQPLVRIDLVQGPCR